MRQLSTLLGTACLFALVLVSPLSAQESPGTTPAPALPAPKVAKDTKTATTKGGRKVIKLEAITVEGRIQKPQAFYILQRSNLNFDELNRIESFLSKVPKSVEHDPF